MTSEEFKNYKFTINTEVEFRGEWYKVKEVDFESEYIGIESGYYLKISEYKGIRESND